MIEAINSNVNVPSCRTNKTVRITHNRRLNVLPYSKVPITSKLLCLPIVKLVVTKLVAGLDNKRHTLTAQQLVLNLVLEVKKVT
jgi:hypothetical protein